MHHRGRQSLCHLIQQKANSYPEVIMLNKGRARLHFTCKIILQPKRKLMKQLKKKLPWPEQVCMEQTSERSASSWLTTIPVSDRIWLHPPQAGIRRCYMWCLRYGCRSSRLPSHCLCGEVFSLSHAFSCPKSAFLSIKHNWIRGMLAEFLTEVCPNVSTEPRPSTSTYISQEKPFPHTEVLTQMKVQSWISMPEFLE